MDEIKEAEVKSHPDLRNRLIEFSIKEDVPEFKFCKLEIRRVLINLMVNAAQASNSTDLIEVGLDSIRNAMVITRNIGLNYSEINQKNPHIYTLHVKTLLLISSAVFHAAAMLSNCPELFC